MPINDLEFTFEKIFKLIATREDPKKSEWYKKQTLKAYIEKDINSLYSIYDMLTLSKDKSSIEYYKNQIYKAIGCNKEEIEIIVNALNTIEEADCVLACIESSDWITSLPKSEIDKQSTVTQYKYSDQIKLHRRILEKDLQSLNVGIRRSQKISKILQSI